ncbi:MAG TPA: MraY family glycosyltransferase [Ktedonobacterales bacterium]|nr:MraY family glycosyltransferase [Ktedonobacterales bacterium]
MTLANVMAMQAASAAPGVALPLVGALLAALLTFGGSVLVARWCRRRGWVDRPEARRVHRQPVPRLGGIAIFAAFTTVALALYRPRGAHETHVFIGLLLAAVLIVAVMAYDDVRGLPPWPRLGVQTLAAGLAIFPGAPGTLIEVIHNPLVMANHGRTILAGWLAVTFTWFWIVGMMNTINWMDGSDGLAGGVVAITATVMAVISWLLGQPGPALLCAVLAGATLGFLPLNWHPARLFMGDSGAMFLGLALAVLANVGGAKLATMLLLLGVPILDTARVIARRLRKGRSPLHYDRSHLHHRLLAGGFSQRQIAALFYAVTAAFGAITILAAYLPARLGVWAGLAPLGGLALAGGTLAAILLVAVLRRRWLRLRHPEALPPSASGSHHRLPAPSAR